MSHISEVPEAKVWRMRAPEIRQILSVLRLPQDALFPRCGCKSKKAVEKLRAAGEDWHGEEGHICADCRCTMPAGWNTKGWYYWPEDNEHGLKNMGHLGVGPCGEHQRNMTKKQRLRLEDDIQREIIAMQQKGIAPKDGGRFRVEISRRSDDASLRKDVRAARDIVKNQLDEIQKKLSEGSELTENWGGRRIPISDKGRIELTIAVAKALSDISKTEFMTAQSEYVHRDEMIVFVNKILQICEQYIKVKEDWESFISQFKQALFDVRSGKRKDDTYAIDERG